MKLFTVQPFIVEDATRFPPQHWLLCLMSVPCFVFALFALGLWWISRPNEASGPVPAVGLVPVFVGLHSLGCLFIWVGRVIRDANHSNTEMTKRIEEQDERIRKLEEQIVALTEPTPTY